MDPIDFNKYPVQHGWHLGHWDEFDERVAIMVADGMPEDEAKARARERVEMNRKREMLK